MTTKEWVTKVTDGIKELGDLQNAIVDKGIHTYQFAHVYGLQDRIYNGSKCGVMIDGIERLADELGMELSVRIDDDGWIYKAIEYNGVILYYYGIADSND